MPVDDAEVLAEIRPLAARRLRLIDQLAASAGETARSCRQAFTAADAGGRLAAAARCEHWAGRPGSLDLAWGAARRFTLVPHVAGPDVASALSQLVRQWRDHLTRVPEARGDDTAAVIHWPSRDIEGTAAMLGQGLWPMTVLAARVTGRHAASRPDPGARTLPPGLLIRRAGPADLDAVASLGVEEIRFDAHFGCVVERAGALASMRDYAAPLLAEPEPWTWIAERDGVPAGLLIAEPPHAATWVAPMTSLSPAAYLMSMFVMPAERGSGLGTALTQIFHRAAEAAGIRVTLLHYEQFNPLSVPFWSQQGYRPLWAAFEARPAASLT